MWTRCFRTHRKAHLVWKAGKSEKRCVCLSILLPYPCGNVRAKQEQGGNRQRSREITTISDKNPVSWCDCHEGNCSGSKQQHLVFCMQTVQRAVMGLALRRHGNTHIGPQTVNVHYLSTCDCWFTTYWLHKVLLKNMTHRYTSTALRNWMSSVKSLFVLYFQDFSTPS